MALQFLFSGTVAKHPDAPDDNEDAFRLAADRGRLVLSDGASESFDARGWANLVVDQLLDEDPTRETLEACEQIYLTLHDPSELTWSKAAAYERGSFATLLIAQDCPERGSLLMKAVGDSLAVWSDGTEMLATLPYSRAEQFDDKPFLLSSQSGSNSEPGAQTPDPWHCADWPYDTQGYRLLLCMTDALGAWLLRAQEADDPSVFERLRGIRTQEELEVLVHVEREEGRMRRDDTTLIIAALTQ